MTATLLLLAFTAVTAMLCYKFFYLVKNSELYPILKIKKLSDAARAPSRNNPTDAGLDLYSAENLVIPQGQGALIKTDIAIELPLDTVGKIEDRSGNGKRGLKVHGGVVDESYRGNVGVVLWNHTGADYEVKVGDRIAQLLIIPVYYSNVKEVVELSDTNRGNKGFGSSGK